MAIGLDGTSAYETTTDQEQTGDEEAERKALLSSLDAGAAISKTPWCVTRDHARCYSNCIDKLP